jgi:hypothetical protein
MYSVTHSRRPKRDGGAAKCVVCKLLMDEREPVLLGPIRWLLLAGARTPASMIPKVGSGFR